MPSRTFEEDHGRNIQIKASVGNGGVHIGASLLVPDGAGKWKAIQLRDSTGPMTVRDVGIFELAPLAAAARLCPLHAKWDDRQVPSLDHIWAELGKARHILEPLLHRSASGQPVDEEPARRALHAMHRLVTNYLAAPASPGDRR